MTNVSYSLWHLDAWSPGGAVWGGLGGVGLGGGIMSLLTGFESLYTHIMSSPLSQLPACGMRCEFSVSALAPCLLVIFCAPCQDKNGFL